jgi:hypothetical protein
MIDHSPMGSTVRVPSLTDLQLRFKRLAALLGKPLVPVPSLKDKQALLMISCCVEKQA